LQVAAQYYARPLPPAVREACVQSAAHYYWRPGDPVGEAGLADIVRAVIRQEGGTTGQIHWNRPNKAGVSTYDMGLMQINSSHLTELAAIGATRDQVINYECLNIYVGTWILKREIVTTPTLWVAIGNYNTGSFNARTANNNLAYQRGVWTNLQKLWYGK
jgi:soluble lytic murein transglycosylase-like protein